MWSAWATDKWTTDPYMHWFNDRVNEQGKAVNLSIKYIGGPEVFPNTEGMEALRGGLIDMAFTASVYHIGLVPEADAMKLSQLRPWEERESGAYDLMNEFHQKQANAYYLWRIPHNGYFRLYLNVLREKPDLTGLKIRSTPAYDPLVKAIGGTTLRMAPPEVYTALERNIVDGYGWPAVGIADRKWEEVTKYMWGPRFYCSPTGVWVNLDKWNGLSEEHRAFLTKMAIEAERDAALLWDKDMEEDRALLLKAGLKEIKFSPEDEKYYLDTAYEAGWALVLEKAPGAAKLKPLMMK